MNIQAVLDGLPELRAWYCRQAIPATLVHNEQLGRFLHSERKEQLVPLYRDTFPELWQKPVIEMGLLERMQACIWFALTIAQAQRNEVTLQPFTSLDEKFGVESSQELPEAIVSGRYVQVGEEGGDCFYYCVCGLLRASLDEQPDHIKLWLQRLQEVLETVKSQVDPDLDLAFLSAAPMGKYRLRTLYPKQKEREYIAIAEATGIALDRRFHSA